MRQVSSGPKRWRVALASVLAALLLGTPVAYAAPTPAQKCGAAKVKAAGAKVYGKAKCHQKALATGAAVDPACLTKAEQKFVAAFGKAEAKGGCTVTGDAAAVEALVDSCLTYFTLPIAGDAKCAAAKMKAVGKNIYAKTKCHQKAFLKGTGIDGLCLGKAETKFTTAIAKADEQGTCSGTAAGLEFMVDYCVEAIVPIVCGDGIIEGPEICDPPGTCPAACDDGLACTTDALLGDPAHCNARCESAPAYEDLGLTVRDPCTNLEWEKKDAPDQIANASNPHDYDNRYTWAGCCDGDCTTVANYCQPNAAAAASCAALSDGGTTGCSECASGTCNIDPTTKGAITTVWDWLNQVNLADFAGHSDWRLPLEGACNSCWAPFPAATCSSCNPHELETILRAPYPCTSGGGICIHPIFSPTHYEFYWSATTDSAQPSAAWFALFSNGAVNSIAKEFAEFSHVRAVRSGP